MSLMRKSEQGFVLPLLLVFIALISLSILSAAEALDRSGMGLQRLARQSQAELAGASAEARVAYLLLTEPAGHRGLRVGGVRLDAAGMLVAPMQNGLRSVEGNDVQELIFDGRPYRLTSSKERYIVEVEIQDEAGLLNLNGGDEPAIERLLMEVAVPRHEAAHLAATLSDFVDGDNLRRLQGAEARNYRLAGRAEPRNAPLRSPRVALAAYSWGDDISPAQARRLFDLAVASPIAQRLNPNTAPPAVLGAVLGIDRSAVRRLLSERENRTLLSLADIVALVGAPLAGGVTELTGIPSRNLHVRVRVRDSLIPDAGYEYQARLLLGPEDADVPLIFRPATSAQRVSLQEPRKQEWTQFPELPDRRARLKSGFLFSS